MDFTLGKDWTLEQWKKVMWSDESRFSLFQIDRCINLHLPQEKGRWRQQWCSTIPSAHNTSFGDIPDLGWLQLDQVQVHQHYVLKEWGQLTTWICWMTRFFHQGILFYPEPMVIFQEKPEGIRLDCERVVRSTWDIIFTHGLAPCQ